MMLWLNHAEEVIVPESFSDKKVLLYANFIKIFHVVLEL